MNYDAIEDLLEKAIRHYGRDAQIIKAVEELSELQKALCKKLNKQGDFTQIIEEVIDVEIMLYQLILILKAEGYKDEDLDLQRSKTLQALEMRIASEGLAEKVDRDIINYIMPVSREIKGTSPRVLRAKRPKRFDNARESIKHKQVINKHLLDNCLEIYGHCTKDCPLAKGKKRRLRQ